MKVLVVGLGSMGKRRIRLLRQISLEFEIIGVDTNNDRRKYCENEFSIYTEGSLDDILEVVKFDVAFICTSPLSHSQIITKCLNKKIDIFSELNLVADGYEQNISLAKNNKNILFLSSTFMYREEIIKINELLTKTSLHTNYIYHIGQYLPDWHPWENYSDFFVGDVRTNGCREIFAIELPWLIKVFGNISKITTEKRKISELNINYNDSYMLLVEHESGHKGMLAVDVVSRRPVRNLEIYNEEIYLQWNGSPNGLFLYDSEKKENVPIQLYNEVDRIDNYSDFIVENAYLNEIISFFECVNKRINNEYGFEEDIKVINLIDKIEA
ncbi:Gfo/Idh/MocA family oxidoreductase [Sphaerochaeta sp. S2]|uniref:Gfo/Idh/MocA family oxidoreductase n=1 Tax=Sphaerochaeta sp. S2 TaxID=2798868 RepID=UPI001E3812B9|nr:Gfo/Idh/MocA family oxidoreductase [Sphaerochaeta sp. S2]